MNNPKNPFDGSDDDRTIIRPNPGGRSTQPTAPPPQAAPAGPAIDTSDMVGLNPLEQCAALLLNLLGQIRGTASHPNPNALHQQLSGEIKKFEASAQRAGIETETIFTARYVLCTTVDEFVLLTPWGANSIWHNQSLLRVFHRETSGGERFFLLLKHLEKDPAKNIDLLELMYVCLALGFQGRYRVESGGAASLEAVRENLYRVIRNQRGDFEMALSPHWKGVDKGLMSKKHRIPAWAMLAIALTVLVFIYGAFSFSLLRHSDPLYATLGTAGMEENLRPQRSFSPPPIRRIADPAPPRFSMQGFLAPEVAEGLVTVQEMDDKTIVLIRGDGLFDSGVDLVKPSYLPLLARIGKGLEETTGNIRVIGHSDNVPISTRRFPSNRALSQARAEAVVAELVKQVSKGERIRALGVADTQPVASNDTAEGRAKNRRVEITILERVRGN
ncbi:MAG: type IVB secretion system protein IcmH/DotU [Xanthomonadales bacterium]|nr:type IVB secretion system protein IcmH/DotU [Xanthomonadales bacterium]